MRPLASSFPVGLAILLTATVLVSCTEKPSTKTSANDSATHAQSAAPLTSAETLASILREKNSLLREHLLAAWAMEHSAAQVLDAIASLPDANATLSLLWLIEAKQPQATGNIETSQFDLLQRVQSRRDTLLRSAAPRPAPSLTDRLRQLAATNPDDALREAASARLNVNARGNLLAAVLTTIAQSSPTEALSRLVEFPEVDAPSTRATILQRWANTAPEAAYAWMLATLPTSDTTEELGTQILTTWAERDQPAALDFALKLPDDAPGQGALPALLARWLREAPADSAAWLGKLDAIDPPLLEAAVKGLSQSHPQLVADLLIRFGDSPTRDKLTAPLLFAWHRQDPLAASAWFAAQPRDNLWLNTLDNIGLASDQLTTADALVHARLAPADANLSNLADYLARNTHDPAAVLKWLLTLGDTTSLNTAMDALLPKLGHITPDAILAFARTLPTESARQAAISAAVKKQLVDNPSATASLLQYLPANEARLARAEVAQTWAELDLNGALAHATSLPPGEDRDILNSAALSAWTRTDPAAAMAWALIQPWTSAQNGLDQAFYNLAKNDAKAAVTALATLPSGPPKTHALRHLLDGGAATDPALIAHTLSSLGSPEYIGEHAHRVVGNYIKHDQAAAISWLRTLPAGVARDGAIESARSQLPSETALGLADLVTPGTKRTRYVERVRTGFYAE